MTPARQATLRFDRQIAHPATRVFGAFSDPEARAIWTPPTPDLNMGYAETDFRPGGKDLCICGPGPAEGIRVETYYHEIQPDRRIVSTETIGFEGAPEAVSLVTAEFTETGGATDLTVIIQVTNLSEEDMERELNEGWTASLENLARYLGQ